MIVIIKFLAGTYISFMRFLISYTAAAVIAIVVYSFWVMWQLRDLPPFDGGTSFSDHFNEAVNLSPVLLVISLLLLLPVWIVAVVLRPTKWIRYPWFFASAGMVLVFLFGCSFMFSPFAGDETNFGDYFGEHIHNWPGLLPAGLAFGLTYWAVSDRLLRSRPSSA
jgi:magnesium-transporting ATPase (P-type)